MLDRNAPAGDLELTSADEADLHHTIRELQSLIERLRQIVSAQARLIGRLYARLPDDGGDA
jgi:hypothetical protein